MGDDKKILVVEDEKPIRRLIRAALDKQGYILEETGSGTEAVEKLGTRSCNLVLLDLMLEDISGWQVLDEVNKRGLRKDLRIMILTAQSAERDILRGWRMGVDEYCMKPFEPDELLKRVKAVLIARPEDLEKRRQDELAKTQLLNLVDSVFEGGNP